MRGTEHSPRQPGTQTRVLLFRPSVGGPNRTPSRSRIALGRTGWGTRPENQLGEGGAGPEALPLGAGPRPRLRRRPRPSAAPARPQLVRLLLRWRGSWISGPRPRCRTVGAPLPSLAFCLTAFKSQKHKHVRTNNLGPNSHVKTSSNVDFLVVPRPAWPRRS